MEMDGNGWVVSPPALKHGDPDPNKSHTPGSHQFDAAAKPWEAKGGNYRGIPCGGHRSAWAWEMLDFSIQSSVIQFYIFRHL